jgi:hypothetical protein
MNLFTSLGRFTWTALPTNFTARGLAFAKAFGVFFG